MPDRPYPLDDAVLELATFRRRLVRRLWADGCLAPDERRDLAAFDAGYRAARAYRDRQRLGQLIEGGATVGTRYMNEIAGRAGCRITRWEDTSERRARVVRLHDHHNDPDHAA